MYIAGTNDLQVTVDEPAVLVAALYLRESAELRPVVDPEIPLLDPASCYWPVWAGRKPDLAPEAHAGRDPEAERRQASVEWSRWWQHLISSPPSQVRVPRAPKFAEFSHVPALRRLLQSSYARAQAWADASMTDPRVKRDHSAPRAGLLELIKHIEAERGQRRCPLQMRVTVIPVRTEHAWQLAPDHLLMTRHLIADTDNALDWLRPRIRALA